MYDVVYVIEKGGSENKFIMHVFLVLYFLL